MKLTRKRIVHIKKPRLVIRKKRGRAYRNRRGRRRRRRIRKTHIKNIENPLVVGKIRPRWLWTRAFKLLKRKKYGALVNRGKNHGLGTNKRREYIINLKGFKFVKRRIRIRKKPRIRPLWFRIKSERRNTTISRIGGRKYKLSRAGIGAKKKRRQRGSSYYVEAMIRVRPVRKLRKGRVHIIREGRGQGSYVIKKWRKGKKIKPIRTLSNLTREKHNGCQGKRKRRV